MSGQERAKKLIVLTEREQKAVDLVVSDIKQYREKGNIPPEFKAKAGDDFNIRKVAQVLHKEGVDISSSYRFNEGSSSHIFQPKPQGEELLPRGLEGALDIFKDIFGSGSVNKG